MVFFSVELFRGVLLLAAVLDCDCARWNESSSPRSASSSSWLEGIASCTAAHLLSLLLGLTAGFFRRTTLPEKFSKLSARQPSSNANCTPGVIIDGKGGVRQCACVSGL